MAGQAALLNFLNNPAQPAAPGQAAPTTVLPPGPKVSKPSPQQKAQADAVKQQQRREESALKAQQQTQQRFEQQATQIGIKAVSGGVQELGQNLSNMGDRLSSWADSVPTPGGIGLLLVVIFLFLWAIVPVNGGNTRLQLLWKTLTGRTRMTASPDAGGTYDASAGTGSGGLGSGGSSNGNFVSPTTELLDMLNIRDFGGNV